MFSKDIKPRKDLGFECLSSPRGTSPHLALLKNWVIAAKLGTPTTGRPVNGTCGDLTH